MYSILIIHLPYVLLHVIGFLFMYMFDSECTSNFGSRIEAFGNCKYNVISESLNIWLAMLTGTIMYVSFYLTKHVFSRSSVPKSQPISEVKNIATKYPAKYIFIAGLLILLLTTIILEILDTLQFNIFKIRGITLIINLYLSHIIIAYSFTQNLKVSFSIWLIYLIIVITGFLLLPSKIHILFFLLNLTYYLYRENRGQLQNLFLPTILGGLFIIFIYVFVISTRDYGTSAFRDFSYVNDYITTILTKAFVRVTLFEPTILTVSLPSLEAFREYSNFFSNPRGYVDTVQLYFQDTHGFNLERFGYAVGLPLIFYAEFGLEGVIMFSFITTLFFNIIHASIASIFSAPLILFIPFYLMVMSDAGMAVVFFLLSLYTFKILKGITK